MIIEIIIIDIVIIIGTIIIIGISSAYVYFHWYLKIILKQQFIRCINEKY